MADKSSIQFDIDAREAGKGARDIDKAITSINASLSKAQQKVSDFNASIGSAKVDVSGFTKIKNAVAGLAGVRLNPSLATNINKITTAMSNVRGINTSALSSLRSFYTELGKFNNVNTQNISTAVNAFKNFKGPSPTAVANISNMVKALHNIKMPPNINQTIGQLNALGVAARLANIQLNSLGRNYNVAQVVQQNRQAHDSLSGLLSPMNLVRNALFQLSAVLSTYVFFEFAKGAYEAKQELIGWEAALTAIIGTSKGAADAIKFTSQMAHKFGLDMSALTSEYKQYIASTELAGIETAKSNKLFEQMSLAFRVLQLDSNKMKRSFNAIQQMFSKGKVTAEELKNQLGDSLPGAVNLMAKALNVGTDELFKMLEGGKVTADSLLDFGDVVEKTFEKGLPAALASSATALQRLGNAWLLVKQEVGSGMEDGLKLWADEVTKGFTTVKDGMLVLNGDVKTFAHTVGENMALALEAFTKFGQSVIAAFQTINTALDYSGIKLMAGAILELVGTGDKVQGFARIMTLAFGALAVTGVMRMTTAVVGFLGPLSNLASGLGNLKKTNPTDIFTKLSKGFTSLITLGGRFMGLSTALSAAVRGIGAAFAILGGPVTLLAAGLALIAGRFVYLAYEAGKLDPILDQLGVMWDEISRNVSSAARAVADSMGVIKDSVVSMWNFVSDILGGFDKVLQGLAEGSASKIAEGFNQALTSMGRNYADFSSKVDARAMDRATREKAIQAGVTEAYNSSLNVQANSLMEAEQKKLEIVENAIQAKANFTEQGIKGTLDANMREREIVRETANSNIAASNQYTQASNANTASRANSISSANNQIAQSFNQLTEVERRRIESSGDYLKRLNGMKVEEANAIDRIIELQKKQAATATQTMGQTATATQGATQATKELGNAAATSGEKLASTTERSFQSVFNMRTEMMGLKTAFTQTYDEGAAKQAEITSGMEKASAATFETNKSITSMVATTAEQAGQQAEVNKKMNVFVEVSESVVKAYEKLLPNQQKSKDIVTKTTEENESLKKAVEEVKKVNERNNTEIQKANQTTKSWHGELRGMVSTANTLASALTRAAAAASRAQAASNKTKKTDSGGKANKFAGGKVYKGRDYTVGERGPEIFVDSDGNRTMLGTNGREVFRPEERGQILPADVTAAGQKMEEAIAQAANPSRSGGPTTAMKEIGVTGEGTKDSVGLASYIPPAYWGDEKSNDRYAKYTNVQTQNDKTKESNIMEMRRAIMEKFKTPPPPPTPPVVVNTNTETPLVSDGDDSAYWEKRVGPLRWIVDNFFKIQTDYVRSQNSFRKKFPETDISVPYFSGRGVAGFSNGFNNTHKLTYEELLKEAKSGGKYKRKQIDSRGFRTHLNVDGSNASPFGFQTGGSFSVPANGSGDSTMAQLMLKGGEQVDITSARDVRHNRMDVDSNSGQNSKQGGNTIIINMEIKTPDPDAFRLSEKQIRNRLVKNLEKDLQ